MLMPLKQIKANAGLIHTDLQLVRFVYRVRKSRISSGSVDKESFCVNINVTCLIPFGIHWAFHFLISPFYFNFIRRCQTDRKLLVKRLQKYLLFCALIVCFHPLRLFLSLYWATQASRPKIPLRLAIRCILESTCLFPATSSASEQTLPTLIPPRSAKTSDPGGKTVLKHDRHMLHYLSLLFGFLSLFPWFLLLMKLSANPLCFFYIKARHGEPASPWVQASVVDWDFQCECRGDGEVNQCSSGPHRSPALLPRPQPPPLQYIPLWLHYSLPGHQPARRHGPGAPHPPVQHHDRWYQGHADRHQAEPLHRRLGLPNTHLQGPAVSPLQVVGLQPQLPWKPEWGGPQRNPNSEEQERSGWRGRIRRGSRKCWWFTSKRTSIGHGHAGKKGAERTQLPRTLRKTHLQGNDDNDRTRWENNTMDRK